MTAYAATAAPAAPPSRLVPILLIVLALHALLLFGLPYWARTVPVTGGPPVFQMRTIALAASPSDMPVTQPEPKPPEPQLQPERRPKPQPAPPTPKLPRDIAPPPVTAPDAQTSTAPTTTATTDAIPSLLQAAPSVTFGGNAPLPSIVPPLPPDQALAVTQQAALPLVPASAAASDARTPGTPEPPPSIQLPRPAQITYQATVTQGGRLVALPTTINWRYDGQFYDLRWILYGPAIGDHSRYATGLITARGLAPVTAHGAQAEPYDLTFDYAQSRLRVQVPTPAPAPPDGMRAGTARPSTASVLPVISVSGSDPSAPTAAPPLPPGVQDPVSFLIQLGTLIAGNPAQYPVNSHIALPVADGAGQILPMDFAIVDNDDLAATGQFEGQRLPALHLVHEAANGQDARIELWLSKRLDYLPIRLMIVRPNGDQLSMMLQSAYLQTPPAPYPVTPPASASVSDAAEGSGGATAH